MTQKYLFGDTDLAAARLGVLADAVAGVPAKVIGRPRAEKPALEMDQSLPNDCEQQLRNRRAEI